MDLIFLSILLFTTIINVIITILMVKHYGRTRYVPSFILGIYFICRAFSNAAYLPIAWFDASAGELILVAYLSASILTNFHTLLLLIFFEAVFGRPLSMRTAPCIAYYGVVICYLLTQKWEFAYSGTNGWNPVFTPEQQLVLGAFMIVIFLLIFSRIVQSLRAGKSRPTTNTIELERVKILPINKLVVIWVLGLIINFIGIRINQDMQFGYVGYAVSMTGFLMTALSYIHDPHAFFLSSAQIQSILFYDASTGVPFLAFGMSMDENLAAGGLFGASSVQREIAGTKGYPTLQVFGDKVFLLAHQQVGNTHVAATLIMNQYLPAMYPTLRHALHIFTNRNRESLEKWKGGGVMDFDKVLPELLAVFDFAWSKERLAEIRKTTTLQKEK